MGRLWDDSDRHFPNTALVPLYLYCGLRAARKIIARVDRTTRSANTKSVICSHIRPPISRKTNSIRGSPRRWNVVAYEINAALDKPLCARKQFRALVEGQSQKDPREDSRHGPKGMDPQVVEKSRTVLVAQHWVGSLNGTYGNSKHSTS
jgi:hypothetical protein